MKKKQQQVIEQIESLITTINKSEEDPNVVGYCLYDFNKKAFISEYIEDIGCIKNINYCADAQEARFFKTKYKAFRAGFFAPSSIGVIPLIKNELFGLTPKPNSLTDEEKQRSEFNDIKIADIAISNKQEI